MHPMTKESIEYVIISALALIGICWFFTSLIIIAGVLR